MSVVIPVHNRSELIGRAVASVVRQTFDDWELIVVDDGSDEDIASAIGSFDDPRVTLVRLAENSGAPVARNAGIRMARGTSIAFLDSDDEWLPHKLEDQLRAMGPQVDAVLCGFEEEEAGRKAEVRPPSGRLTWEQLIYGPRSWITTGQLLVRASALEQFHFDEKLRAYQDWDILLRLSQSNVIIGISDVLMIKHGHDRARIFSGARRHRALLSVAEKYRAEIGRNPSVDRRWRMRRAMSHWQLGDFRSMRAVLDEAVADHPDDGELRSLRAWARAGPLVFALFLKARYSVRRVRRRRDATNLAGLGIR